VEAEAAAQDSDRGRGLARALHPSAPAVAGAEAQTAPGACGKQAKPRAEGAVLAEVELVEGLEAERGRAAVERAGAEVEAQADLAARVAGQELAAAVRTKVGPVAEDRVVEDRVVEDPVEPEEAAVSVVLAA